MADLPGRIANVIFQLELTPGRSDVTPELAQEAMSLRRPLATRIMAIDLSAPDWDEAEIGSVLDTIEASFTSGDLVSALGGVSTLTSILPGDALSSQRPPPKKG